ncbi:MAG: hypothetical protein KVP17_000824 [Porospora cf. gigantea B]|uniref:uncharacterized protein n=1 Tax=Porospora cf. gigantea B TaxID=2853592 RepID=UPI003571B3B2|nr:MAG: hypothetical protein KVP17_000824 [Porospora cf. gigantea B]
MGDYSSIVLQAVAAGFGAALIGELVFWFIFYVRGEGRVLEEKVLKVSRKVELLQAELDSANDKQVSKVETKIQTKTEHLEEVKKEYDAARSKSQLWCILPSLFTMPYINKWFASTVVAQLPFVPFWPLIKLTQQRLGDNPAPTDCGIMFFYMLSLQFFKPLVAQLMGSNPPQTRVTPKESIFAQ